MYQIIKNISKNNVRARTRQLFVIGSPQRILHLSGIDGDRDDSGNFHQFTGWLYNLCHLGNLSCELKIDDFGAVIRGSTEL